MQHLWHLVRMDLRRFWLVLVVAALIQVTDTVLRGLAPTLAADPPLARAADSVAGLVLAARVLSMVLVVPLVVHEHTLVGSDAFWMTRPIGWQALAASKLGLLAVPIVAVPVLCIVGLMLWSGMPASSAAPPAVHVALWQSLWLLVLMAVAAVTRNMARFALAAAGGVITLVLILNVLLVVALRYTPDGPQREPVVARTVVSPAMSIVVQTVVQIVVTGALLAATLVQYRVRRRRAAAATAVAGITVAIVIGNVMSSELHDAPVPAWTEVDGAVTLKARTSVGEFSPAQSASPWSRADGWRLGSVSLSATGLEPGWLPSIRLIDSAVTFDDGVVVPTVGNAYHSSVQIDASDEWPDHAVARRVLGVERLSGNPTFRSQPPAANVISFRESDFLARAGARGAYHGRFFVDLDRLHVVAVLPLKAGAVFQDARRRLVIDRVLPGAGTVAVHLRTMTVDTMFDESVPPVDLYLRNLARAEAIASVMHGGFGLQVLGGPSFFGTTSSFRGPGPGFHTDGVVLGFPGRDTPEPQDVRPDADWLSGAELVAVATTTEGSVARAIDIAPFQIAAAAGTSR